VDGDFVLLHSKYEGVGRYAGPAIAFDLFRFKDGKIVEHWGGQQPETPPNLSGRTEVDGPTDVRDREKTEANRTLVRAYRETVMVALRFDRIEEFVENARYAQQASNTGVAKEGGQLNLTPRRFVAEGNFVLVLSEGISRRDLLRSTICFESRMAKSSSTGTCRRRYLRGIFGKMPTVLFERRIFRDRHLAAGGSRALSWDTSPWSAKPWSDGERYRDRIAPLRAGDGGASRQAGRARGEGAGER
jgi:hypothetical protein